MAVSPSSFTSPFDSSFGQPQVTTFGGPALAVSGLNWGPFSLSRALLPREAAFLLHASLSWTVTGTVTANFPITIGGFVEVIVSPGGTSATGYTAGDGGPVDVTAAMQGMPGWFDIGAQAATGTSGTGTVSAQLTLVFTAKSAL